MPAVSEDLPTAPAVVPDVELTSLAETFGSAPRHDSTEDLQRALAAGLEFFDRNVVKNRLACKIFDAHEQRPGTQNCVACSLDEAAEEIVSVNQSLSANIPHATQFHLLTYQINVLYERIRDVFSIDGIGLCKLQKIEAFEVNRAWANFMKQPSRFSERIHHPRFISEWNPWLVQHREQFSNGDHPVTATWLFVDSNFVAKHWNGKSNPQTRQAARRAAIGNAVSAVVAIPSIDQHLQEIANECHQAVSILCDRRFSSAIDNTAVCNCTDSWVKEPESF